MDSDGDPVNGIKPTNVLVSLYDGKPVPKVIDFGVAKAIDQKLTERTLFTQHGAIVGTLEYMSPEQAENSALDIDTRSDVYSLGVLLYELMTGSTPLERNRTRLAPYSEVLRRIRDEEPPRPSARLSKTEKLATIAADRSMEPARLARLVRGELDWIAIKALDKDRNRRYATANDLARDLERYLAGEPVEAGAPSAVDRVRRYARKHFVPLAVALAFAAVLVLATAVSTWQAVRATREQGRARQSEAEAKALLGFFRDKVLSAARPRGGKEGGLGPKVTIREALDAAEPTVTADFAAQPMTEAAVRHTLGTTYLYLSAIASAIPQLELALAIRVGLLGDDHRETLGVREDLAVAYRRSGRVAEAIPLFEGILAAREAALGVDHGETQSAMSNLAVAYMATERFADAIPLQEQVYHHSLKFLGPDDPDTVFAMSNLAALYKKVDRVSDALPLFEQAYKIRKAKLAPDDADLLYATNGLAAIYQDLDRSALAIPLFEDLLARRQVALGPDHLDTLVTKSNLALAYRDAGRGADAIRYFEEVLAGRRARLPAGHPDTLKTMNDLADAYVEQKRWSDAQPLLRECLPYREKMKTDEWRRFHTMVQLGATLEAQGKFADAEPLLTEGYEGLVKNESKVPRRRKKVISDAATRIAPFYDAWGKPEKASAWRQRLAAPTGEQEIER